MRRSPISILSNRSGTAGIEFVLIFPVIALLFVGSVTVFDLYRNYQRIIEANSVTSDLITRQTSINKAYFDNAYGVFVNLQDPSGKDMALRVSSIVRNGKDYSIAWTKSAGQTPLLDKANTDLKILVKILPDIASGDSLVFVESVRKFPIVFSLLGFGSFTFKEHTFARPRFINAVTYTDK